MLNIERVMRMAVLLAVIVYGFIGQAAYADDYEPIKSLEEKYHKAGDDNKKKDVYEKLRRTAPKTQEDMDNLRKIFLMKDWDEILFIGSTAAIRNINDPLLDKTLIDILKDEKAFIEKVTRKDKSNKSDKEVDYRVRNVEFIIHKLSIFKSQNAVPILKEYTAIPGIDSLALEALATIGDRSVINEMKDKAYKGEDINYGGQGLDEAITIVRDLEDQSKKEQWPKIAKQLFHIRDPKIKPYLKRLFNHEVMDVRWEAAGKFRALADENDVQTIIEMTKNQDHIVRTEAIDAMIKLKNIEFGDELIALLNDWNSFVRSSAARAIGYKKISRAVPYLEKAIKESELRDENAQLAKNDKLNELRIREEAYIALYILTGKKYDYRGKTYVIEEKAERQKEYPTYYY